MIGGADVEQFSTDTALQDLCFAAMARFEGQFFGEYPVLKEKLARGAVWIAATRFLVNAIGFVSTIVLARLLLPSDFGVVAVATTVMAVVASLTEISLSSALMQHRDPTEAHFDTAFTLNFIRSIIVAAATAAAAWPVARFYGDPRLFGLVLALALVSGTTGLANPKMVLFWRDLVFWQDFFLRVAQKVAGFIAALVVAIIWKSYWAFIVGAAASEVVVVALSYVLIHYRPRLTLASWRDLMSFSIWLSASQIVGVLNNRFDNLFIGYAMGRTAVGYYSYADNLASLATREVTSPVANTLLPIFARLQDEPERLRSAHARAQALLFAIAMPVGCGFAMVAEPVVHLALGDKWLPAVFAIEVIAVVLALQTIGNTQWALAVSLGQTRLLFYRDAANVAFRLPILITGFWFGGFVGVVLARAFAGAIALLLNFQLIRRLIGTSMREQVAHNLRPLIATGAMALAIWGLRSSMPSTASWNGQAVQLAAQIVLGALVYLSTTFVVWRLAGSPEGIEHEVLSALKKLHQRYSNAG
jgi:lipopolysaccharide exporter